MIVQVKFFFPNIYKNAFNLGKHVIVRSPSMHAKTHLFLLSLGLLCLTFSAFAAPLCEAPVVKRCFCFCPPELENVYFRGGYTSKKGIGREDGYGTLGAFYMRTKEEPDLFPYIDLRLHIMDNRKIAGNVGIGFQRTDVCDASTMTRGYLFFDWRDTRYRLYRQISFGGEWTGPYFNLYGNFYLPLDSSGKRRTSEFRFRNVFRLEQTSKDYSYRGFDFNASRYIYMSDWYRFYISPGIYYYRGRRESVYGGKIRFEIELYRSVILTFQTSHDKVFNTRTYGAISLNLPTQGPIPDLYRTVPVRREEIIPVKNRDKVTIFRRR